MTWCRAFPPTKSRLQTSYYVKRMHHRFRTQRSAQRGFSLIELLIVIAIILIILSIALPQMSKSQMHAQTQYQSTFGQYANSIAQLGPPASSGAPEGAQAANLIPPNLATGSTGGYNYTVTQTPSGYSVVAVPKAFNNTGRRSFYTDQTGVIRENSTQEPATVNSPEVR